MDLILSLANFCFPFLLLGATTAMLISKYATQLSDQQPYTINITTFAVKEHTTTTQTPHIKSQDYHTCGH